MATPRVVITHDFMETYGGAERVTEEMAAAFPDASVVALLGRPAVAERMGVSGRFHSLVAPRPRVLEHYRLLAPAWGSLAARAVLPDADVVLASSYAYAHRLRTRNDAPMVCYCHSPLRFAWSMTESYRERWAPGGWRARAFAALVEQSQRADVAAARRVHTYATQSEFVADQVRRFYGRECHVIGAPIDCDRFRPAANGRHDDYFLIVSRLVEPYKRVGLAIEAFRRLGRRLVIAGDGPAMAELRAAAPAHVEFTGHLEDHELIPLMQRCAAAVFPSRDDFGLVPVEVQACGRPVVAYGDGGALHTVAPGVTGELFPAQTVESLLGALGAFDPDAYDPSAIRAHAMRWDRRAFHARLRELVHAATE